MGSDVHQTRDGRSHPGFSNDGAAIAMSYKNARSILLRKDTFRGSYIFFKGCLRLLDDADVVAILDKNVIDAFPARTICPGTVHQNNIPNAMIFVVALRGERTAGQQQ